MRITGGDNPLDATSVHPESYEAAAKLLKVMGYDINQISSGELIGLKSRIEDMSKLADELGIGTMTLEDIVKELEKPGRDPRDEMPKPILRKDVLDMKDLTPGMILKGTVRNVIDFGAFVDIGVHQDGLVHISQMSAERRIEHPLDIVSVGDIVDVRVIDVDTNKGRISLSMILDEKEAANRSYKNNSDKNGDKKNNKNNGSRNNKSFRIMDNKRRKLSYRTFHYHRTSLNQIQNINTRLILMQNFVREPMSSCFYKFPFMKSRLFFTPRISFTNNRDLVYQFFFHPRLRSIPLYHISPMSYINRTRSAIQSHPSPIPQLTCKDVWGCTNLKYHAIPSRTMYRTSRN